jgi:hypothetical protein
MLCGGSCIRIGRCSVMDERCGCAGGGLVCAQVNALAVARRWDSLVSRSSEAREMKCRLAAQCASKLGASCDCCPALLSQHWDLLVASCRRSMSQVLWSVQSVVAQGGIARAQASDVCSVTSCYRGERQLRSSRRDRHKTQRLH